ncbi:lantibiotic dehydratase [Streptococcus merionis]|uniref:Serine/threoninedehydratase n=1 Tax=Streptococcus merionis TaxID=400065 RepID=A0A239SQL6_9STRE|nr:lantibiotic dehydratase [Streptococcus merionis]SNU86953.1 serine/threoninedehydratase [Streptococcus merionis]
MYNIFPRGMIRIPLQKQEFYNKGYEELINDKVFMEQLLVASPSLYNSVINIDKCNEKKKQNVKVSLKSYAKRAAFRTTPFGIFTAINVVDLTNENNSNVQKISFAKKAAPDYLWVYSLVKSYEIKNIEKLDFKINTAAFIQGDRYVLPFTVNEFEEDRNISLLKPVQILIEKCQKDYVSYEALINILKNSYPEVALEVLTSFIYNLVENDFLISDLRPPICNINSLDYLLSKLEKGKLINDLHNLKNMIEDYNDLKIGEGSNLLLRIFDVMKNIHKYDNGGNYLKVDSLAKFDGDFDILSEKSSETIKQFAGMFVKLNASVKRRGGRKNSFEEYQLKFIGKYGENCAIPFVEVINKDIGIGFPEYYKDESGEEIELSDPIMQMFEKKYEDALLNGSGIEFSSRDLDDFEIDQNNSLESFELNFNIKKLNNDVKLYLGANIGSGQAGRSFGRFYTLSERLRTTIKKLNQQNCMNVELSFVPKQIRIANVMQNYSDESFNTSFFTTSWDSTNEIRLEDIYIRYSEGKFHFTTRDGENELKFTMNNMLNSDSQSKVLRLLVDISEFEYGLSHWSLFPWDILAQERVYIPEISFEGITIATAQWNLSVMREQLLTQNKFTDKKVIFDNFRKTYKVPKDSILKYADNELRLDLSMDDDLEILFKNIKKYALVSLREIEKGESIFKEYLGNYNAEIVVPIIKNLNKKVSRETKVIFKNEIKKTYLPFCDWLFLKLYGPKERQNELLSYWNHFFANRVPENCNQTKMFYMRYNDINDHVRIRVNCNSIENNFSLYLSVVHDLLPQLIENGIISDIEVSSYKPEVNRYGGPDLISYAEEIFCKESILLMNNTIEFSDNERLICATYLVLHYLNYFFKDKETRLSFLFENYTGKYKKEFKNLPIDLPIEYMKSLNGVASALDKYDFFQEMDKYLASYMEEYNQFGSSNTIYNTKFNLVGSFLHLSMNRLNGIDREFEEKVYCFAYYTLNAQQYI